MYVKNLPFEPTYSSDDLATAETFLKEKKNFSGTANFIVVGTRTRSFTNQPCHGALTRQDLGNVSLVATETGHTRKGFDKSLIEPMLRYFLEEHPLFRFVINKDFEFCRDYGIIVSADVPAPMMQNVCIMARHFYEFEERAFLAFNEMLSLGVSPALAFALLSGTSVSSNIGGEKTLDDEVVPTTGHKSMALPHLDDLFKYFLPGLIAPGYTKLGKNWNYRTSRDYYGGVELFGAISNTIVKSYLADDDVKQALVALRNGEEKEAYVPPNPFVRGYNAKKAALSYKELFFTVAPLLNERLNSTERKAA